MGPWKLTRKQSQFNKFNLRGVDGTPSQSPAFFSNQDMHLKEWLFEPRNVITNNVVFLQVSLNDVQSVAQHS